MIVCIESSFKYLMQPLVVNPTNLYTQKKFKGLSPEFFLNKCG